MSSDHHDPPLENAHIRHRPSFAASGPSTRPHPGSLKDALGSTDSFDLPVFSPHLTAGVDRVRRRSEALRSRDTLALEAGSRLQERDIDAKFELEEEVEEVDEDVDSKTIRSSVGGISTPGVPSLRFEVDEPLSSALRKKMRRREWMHFAVMCLVMFQNGWNDGSTGPLIPRIQQVYHVDFMIVSLIFVCNCVGYVGGALANVWLADRLGLGKAMFIAALSPVIAYCIQAAAPPFPLFAAACVFSGFGFSILNASANGYVGSLKAHVSTKLCLIHSSYGIGAFAAPLAATHFSSQQRWSFHYLISLGIAVLAFALVVTVYRFKTLNQLLRETGHEVTEGTSTDGTYSQIFRIKVLHLLALFALIYVGTEVTLGGWIVSFLNDRRGGGPSAGYVSSGFFGGLALGRVLLIGVNRLVGERRVVFIYVTLSIALEITIWRVPSLIENAVAVSIIGLLFGPMYPILVNQASRIMPKWLLTGSLGWIAGVGTAGSAVLPFITGILAARFGIGALQPFVVAMMVVLLCIWAMVPKSPRRPE
ncbi:MFS general substrate transporter [Punctularia strigosozonata HHB-11173 SS5]|uniref:MFS general substrate transporter n=1 Tax=Punctularia strigosozonata (strain HHB-11173) TaxID=741275 RepID=UPI000441756A|nr:MFS general substrate transporter [Punctularia strigosozonata HHB-11173 SS5]EIN13104.1 MFS general substrate transporter [Punctularia strigosozonata HHB-11173 SS5]